mmetsp:Transcript_19394/g.28009  ORF Transcript_19394/g.28009 Transcript_19394/m.28009 type:complete len:114 (-) Transcript_19394:349-690(-)
MNLSITVAIVKNLKVDTKIHIIDHSIISKEFVVPKEIQRQICIFVTQASSSWQIVVPLFPPVSMILHNNNNNNNNNKANPQSVKSHTFSLSSSSNLSSLPPSLHDVSTISSST